MARFGFREVEEYDEWNLLWADSTVSLPRMIEMKKFQVRTIYRYRLFHLTLNSSRKYCGKLSAARQTRRKSKEYLHSTWS